MFHSFHFWFLVTFGDEITKILRNLCLHFERQNGQDGKHRKKITQLKWPKTKRQKYGTNKTIKAMYKLDWFCLIWEIYARFAKKDGWLFTTHSYPSFRCFPTHAWILPTDQNWTICKRQGSYCFRGHELDPLIYWAGWLTS